MRDDGGDGRPGEEDDGAREVGEGKAGWAGRRPLGRLASGPTRERGEVGHGWAERPDGPAGR
jgi:hypothetical protein